MPAYFGCRDGGGVYASSAQVTLLPGSNVLQNRAASGGGLNLLGSRVRISNATLRGNAARSSDRVALGGALKTTASDVQITGGDVSSNRADVENCPAPLSITPDGVSMACKQSVKQVPYKAEFYVSNERMTKPRAETYCRQMGMRLAAVHSRPEYLALRSTLITARKASGQFYHMGASKSASGWSWDDGSAFDYPLLANLADDDPSNHANATRRELLLCASRIGSCSGTAASGTGCQSCEGKNWQTNRARMLNTRGGSSFMI